MSKFKVGDEIIVVNGEDYAITKEGSIGIVAEIYEHSIRVHWSKTTGSVLTSIPHTVNAKDVMLLEAYNSPLYQAML
jgi:hypothetical protein